MNTSIEIQQKALSWWDHLRNTRLMNGGHDKGYYTDLYFGWNMRMFKHLSTEEIIEIYKKEICKEE